MSSSAVHIRPADRSDEVSLREMQERSTRILCRRHYSPDLIEAFISHVGTMDTSLLDEAGYFLAEGPDGILASGGWSTARPGYAAVADDACHPAEGGPVVRAVYVRPDAAGRGIGRQIMNTVEAGVVAAGHRAVTLTAMLSAVEFYRRLGCAEQGDAQMVLPGNHVFRGMHMRKELTAAVGRPWAA